MVFMFIMVGAFTFPNFQTDTYDIVSDLSYSALDTLTRNGRPIPALIYKLTSLCHINAWGIIRLYTILGVVCLYAGILLYEDSLRKYVANDLLRCLLATVVICNIYMLEFMLFLEKVTFMLAILACVIAYRKIVQLIENGHTTTTTLNQVICYIQITTALLVAVCCYQPTLSLFPALLLPVILRPEYAWKRKLRWLLTGGALYAAAGAANLLILTLCGSSRMGGTTLTIAERIHAFFAAPVGFSIVSKNAYWAVIAVAVVGCLAAAMKRRGSVCLHMALLALGVEVCALAPVVLGEGWVVPRVIYVAGCLPGLLIVFGFTNGCFESRSEGIVGWKSRGIALFLTLVLLVSANRLNRIYKDVYITNALDRYRCTMIGNAIKDYEQETGNTVCEVVFYKDAGSDYYNTLMKTNPLFRFSSFQTAWSELTSINLYLETKYKRGVAKPEVAEYFARQNWQTFSEKQLLFDGQTLHICIY